MTVDTLLECMKKERMDAITSVWTYRSKAFRALMVGDNDVAKMLSQMIHDATNKVEKLSIAIDEIEKRVS